MSDTQLATRPKASQQLALSIGMEPAAMLSVIKAQCFKGNPANVTDEQLAAFVSIANEMGVNPLLPGMLYAFPVQGGGIVPMMGPDGVYKKLAEHKEVDSWETTVFPEDVALPPTHAVTKIYRVGRERPMSYTALLSEWKVNNNPNWNSRTRHMLGLRSLKQCARQIIHGIPFDEDERVIMGEINVTPGAETKEAAKVPDRPATPARAKKGVASVVETAPPPAEKEKIKTVEADFVEATPPAAAPEPVAEPAKVDPVPEPAKVEPPPATKVETRAFLREDEELETVCEIVSVECVMGTRAGKPMPCVRAKVKGGYMGEVLHIDGASGTTEKDMVVLAPWNAGPGTKLNLKLVGKKLKDGKTIQARVNEAKAVAAAEQQDVEF